MNENLEKEVKTLRPFTRFIYTIGELPTSYLMSMTYDEQLIWLCNYLTKTVIPTINNNAEAVKEVQDLVKELQDYMNNYFDNLDVQEEINNKLDDMAESGQLTEIIAEYLQLAGVLAFNNVNEMKNSNNLTNGSFVRTYGFYNYKDGGGAFYKIRNITNQDIVNNIDIINLNNYTNLIAELIYEDEINVLQIGCKNDNSEDISNIINYMTEKVNLYFPAGFYKIENPLVIKSNIRGNFFHRDNTYNILKDSVLMSSIISNENDLSKCVINLSNVNYGFEIKNINIKCNSNENGIYGYYEDANRINIKNISISNVHNANGIFLNSTNWISRLAYLENITIFGTNEIYASSTGIKIFNSGDIRMNNIEIIGCQTGINNNTSIIGNNFHIWCGCLQGEDQNDWWSRTNGIIINEGIFNNIYIDSAYLPIVGSNKQYCMINNLITMNDNSMSGSNKFDSSLTYNFKGTINNWTLYIDNRVLYPFSEDGIFTNVQMISRNDTHLFTVPKLYGSRYNSINYSFRNIPAENKLIEIAKIYCDNSSGVINLKCFHANQQYSEMQLNFINGNYDTVNVIKNIGTDNYYITKNKTNNIYTVYIDTHSNYNEWIGVTINKGIQMNSLNGIDLNIQLENGESYTPNKIDYDINTFNALI